MSASGLVQGDELRGEKRRDLFEDLVMIDTDWARQRIRRCADL